jgi:hypothetical protein
VNSCPRERTVVDLSCAWVLAMSVATLRCDVVPKTIVAAPDVKLLEGSDFSCSFLIGFDSSSSRRGPVHDFAGGRAGDLSGPVQRPYLHAWFLDHAGSGSHSHYRAYPCCLSSFHLRQARLQHQAFFQPQPYQRGCQM